MGAEVLVADAVATDVVAGDVATGAFDTAAFDGISSGVADTAAGTIDATANTLGDIPTTDIPTSDVPTSDGGLPPNDGPMGPPEQMGPPSPDTSKFPSISPKALQMGAKIAKLFAPTPTRARTQGLGQSNESPLKGMTMSACNFLCNQAEFLTNNSGTSYRGGLEKLQQLPASAYASTASPVDMYAMQDQMNVMGQSPVGTGLGYAGGGSAVNTWKEAFCEKNLRPNYVCDKPELMHYQNTSQSHGLSPLKQIHSSMSGGYAKGGLPEKYHAAAPDGHNPEFITGMTGYYACGGGTGQSDDIPAMLHDGDYVMDAESVSALGDGSSKAGRHVLDGFRTQVPHKAEGGSNPVPAKIADGEYVFPESFVTALGGGDNKRGAEILDGLRTKLRAHKRGAPLDKIPPKAKDPIDYIKKAKA
jgi:hypothetical protein